MCSYSFKLFAKLLKTAILACKSLSFSNQPYIKISQQVETPMAHGNYDSFVRSKYFYFFNAPYVILEEFLGVKTQIFFIAKLRRSVLQLSRAHFLIIAPWQHYFERLRQRLAIVCNSVSEFTDPKFKLLLQYLCSKDERVIIT